MEMIDPFGNESEALQIDDLTIENRTDRVSIYGSIDITRDRRGLERARRLAQLFDTILARLSREDLPEEMPPPTNIEVVDNPFK
jgi:hypothetical protein